MSNNKDAALNCCSQCISSREGRDNDLIVCFDIESDHYCHILLKIHPICDCFMDVSTSSSFKNGWPKSKGKEVKKDG